MQQKQFSKQFSSVSEKKKTKKQNKGVLKKSCLSKDWKKDQMFSFSHSEELPGKSLHEIIIFVIYLNAV